MLGRISTTSAEDILVACTAGAVSAKLLDETAAGARTDTAWKNLLIFYQQLYNVRKGVKVEEIAYFFSLSIHKKSASKDPLTPIIWTSSKYTQSPVPYYFLK